MNFKRTYLHEPNSIFKEGFVNDEVFMENDDRYLEISEFFCDTIQGENFIGYPSAFLRLQHCTMNCRWCDTASVWRRGQKVSFNKIFEKMEEFDLPRKLKEGQHLVLTGGSPLLQQDRLVNFITEFIITYNFKPFIEIENECTISPREVFVEYVDLWNNSPKLSNSGNLDIIRYQPEIIKKLAALDNSWFKFVISKETDWNEIQEMYLKPDLIKKEQIVLMPLGGTREELHQNKEMVISLAISENVRYCTREHIEVWDKRTGV